MKTNTIKVILSAIAVSAVSLFLVRNAAVSSLLPTVAVAISYLAAVAILVVAALDNRTGPKDYAAR